MSESAMVDFIIATGLFCFVFYFYFFCSPKKKYSSFSIAQKSPSPQDLINSLVRAGANDDTNTQQFCSNLFTRVPRKQTAKKKAIEEEKQAKRKEEREQAKLRKANEAFQILMDDVSIEENKDIRKKEKKLRKKRKQEDLSDDDTEVKTTDRKKRGMFNGIL